MTPSTCRPTACSSSLPITSSRNGASARRHGQLPRYLPSTAPVRRSRDRHRSHHSIRGRPGCQDHSPLSRWPRKEPRKQRRLAQPAPDRDPLLLSYGGIPRSSQRRRCHARTRDPAQARRHPGANVPDAGKRWMPSSHPSIAPSGAAGETTRCCLLLYNTGARVSEIAILQSQITIGSKSYVQLHGKGRKDRMVRSGHAPRRYLKEWFRELATSNRPLRSPAFEGNRCPASRYTCCFARR